MHHPFEPLERRAMLSVSSDSAGWTVVSPAADTRVIYVSSSAGNDANDGLDAARPVKSLGKAQSLVRDGSADWMLLRRGDVFGSFGEWKKSGRSAAEPLYISAYGTGARPQINSGVGSGFYTFANAGRVIRNVVLSSVSFFADTYDHYNGSGETAGVRLTGPVEQMLIEDVVVRGYKDNVVVDAISGSITGLTIRRSVITDAHASSGVGNGHSQGIYVGPRGADVLIEQNVLDHNGWRQGVAGDRTYYSHNIYTQTGSNVTVRDNFISQGSFYGVKLNGSGLVHGNFFLRNSESVYLESPAVVTDNVITEAVDMPAAGWGVGINTQKSPDATIRGNLITKVLSAGATGVAGIQLFNNGTPFRGTIEGNVVYDWRNGLLNLTPGAGVASVVIRNNQLQMTNSTTAAADHRSSASASTFVYSGNTYAAGTRTGSANRVNGSFLSVSQWIAKTGETDAAYRQISYPDPTRDAARYAQSIGVGTSAEALIAAARGLSRTTWNAALSAPAIGAWYWAGFRSTATPQQVRVLWMAADLAGSSPKVRIGFDADLGSSLAAGDLLVANQSTGQIVAPQSATFDPATRTATFGLPTTLPDGEYAATILAGSVQAPTGGTLATGSTVNFHFLAGDANLDRAINVGDFAAMAANFNHAGTFGSGDFDYSGLVGLADFSILASRFNQNLTDVIASGNRTPSATTPVEPTGVDAPTRLFSDERL